MNSLPLPGFDAFGALLVAVAIDDIGRFKDAKSLVSFMGLCPMSTSPVTATGTVT